MHGFNIDLKTGQAIAPDHGCTRTYPVRVENGRIMVGLTVVAETSCDCLSPA